jgi:hypothetical protein
MANEPRNHEEVMTENDLPNKPNQPNQPNQPNNPNPPTPPQRPGDKEPTR